MAATALSISAETERYIIGVFVFYLVGPALQGILSDLIKHSEYYNKHIREMRVHDPWFPVSVSV